MVCEANLTKLHLKLISHRFTLILLDEKKVISLK